MYVAITIRLQIKGTLFCSGLMLPKKIGRTGQLLAIQAYSSILGPQFLVVTFSLELIFSIDCCFLHVLGSIRLWAMEQFNSGRECNCIKLRNKQFHGCTMPRWLKKNYPSDLEKDELLLLLDGFRKQCRKIF